MLSQKSGKVEILCLNCNKTFFGYLKYRKCCSKSCTNAIKSTWTKENHIGTRVQAQKISGRISWKRGLTKNDERVNSQAKTLIGKKRPEEVKNRIRNTLLDRYKNNPDYKKKISEKVKETYFNHPEIKLRIKNSRANQIFPSKDTSIELKIQNYLKELEIDFFTHQYIQEIEHGYQCDIFIPILNLVIECDGNYWHKYPTGRDIDRIRTQELIEKGFKVLRLWESEIKVMNLDKFKTKININKICKSENQETKIKYVEVEAGL